MRVRVQGLPGEAEEAAGLIGTVMDVISSSGQRPLRGESKEVFVYLEIRLRQSSKRPGTSDANQTAPGHLTEGHDSA